VKWTSKGPCSKKCALALDNLSSHKDWCKGVSEKVKGIPTAGIGDEMMLYLHDFFVVANILGWWCYKWQLHHK
jgi:hypothetical protein